VPPLPFLDTTLFRWLNLSAANPLLDRLFPVLTSLHHQTWFVATLASAALVALWRGNRRVRTAVLVLALSAGMSDAFCSRAVKRFIQRERPCQAVVHGRPAPASFPVRVVRKENCPGSQGFPSNHAANTMAVAAAAWYLCRRRFRWAWFLLPLIIGWTRVYLGYHYPSDVLGGWLVGGLIAAILLRLFRKALAPSSGPFSETAGNAR